VPNPADRRSVLVAPTEAGREAIEALDGALRAVLADAQDPAFREQFTTRLIRLSGAADRARAELGGGS
jgi:DNA-binding MarR family transcriptional regulator